MGRRIPSRGDSIGGNLKHNMDQWEVYVYLQGETLLEVI